EEMFFRKTISINTKFVEEQYTDKTVLVTGGGGSIGSELCRQIARFNPKKLVIVDIYENNAYDIEQYLLQKFKDGLNLQVEICSVRDKQRLDAVFEKHKPDVVFHAAAHKHVPLMEKNSGEAIKNNVLGTLNTADVAEKHGVKKFILISTDKAVNPTNVMGASKRVCEMIIRSRIDSQTEFCAVRFGNVLGSNGSVIPLFKKQIESGGPITITDKRIIRYFMTIKEAVQLVIEAGVMANKGEIYVLDMGKPVKILDLAENMIKLSGFTPYKDIDIVEVGLRPGEKLYEELLIRHENCRRTPNNLIFIERDLDFTRQAVAEKIEILKESILQGDDAIKRSFKQVVPTYCDPDDVNCNMESLSEPQITEFEHDSKVPAV
ncbi:MAG: nucleoside-diphosphate sugar epimerase/dehydratase, partial [bacterium]|nr:nucleoside-diphosphate sugar epimerase/dehydratase [bacterium]